MTKKRAIVNYDKLSIEQKKQLLLAFPDGFSSGMTQIKTPTGETLDALFWETDEIIYLVKIPKMSFKTKSVDDDDDDDFDDDIPKFADVKGEEEDEFEEEEEDDYDSASDLDDEDDSENE